MKNSQNGERRLLPEYSALQHERAPRPLPLFLELLRETAERNPELGREALRGLRAYEEAERSCAPKPRPEVGRIGSAALRDHGGEGPPAILIPSLINPPRILDLDEDVSLANAVAQMNRRTLLLDWGPASGRSSLSVAGHVEELLLRLLRNIGEPAALIGYCLGGTMTIAAACSGNAERVVTLATPWHFDSYPPEALTSLRKMWAAAEPAAKALGALPMEILQASFWSLDPERTVRKFADFGRLEPESAQAQRFVALEDWANEGEPLPYPAARELIEDLFGDNLSGRGEWVVAGHRVAESLGIPLLNLTAEADRIAPPASAPKGTTVPIPSGHVGMIVGSARWKLHRALKDFLDPACRSMG